MAHLGNSIFVVAIDFGTTYSGYAFASKQDFANDPPKYSTSAWQGSRLLSLKAPTAVLLNGNKELVAFGYDAENQFSELLSNDEHEDYYYFHQFKMLLHNQRVTRTTEIKDVSKKSMQAIKVFSLAIEYLKNHLLEKIQQRLKNALQDDDLYFVLTVPAIWDDPSKQFMREAAEAAGIKKDKLAIALEPEAASIFCQKLKTDKAETGRDFCETVKSGMKYMVIDLGGGTADITVHQRISDGTIQEVVPPSGGPWGGKSIDEAFFKFLCEICGTKVMEDLKSIELEDYIDLFREFETKKRSVRNNNQTNVVITLPVSLTDLVKQQHKKFEMALEKSRHRDTVKFSKQKLHIAADTFRGLFKNTIDEIIKLVGKLLNNDKIEDLKTILMVGGFSECELLQDAVRAKIGAPRKLIIPEEAGLAVLKGAVLFGHQPRVVSQRISRVTYGIQSWPDWDPDMHPETKKVTINGQVRCKDVFFKYMTKGDRITPGHEVSQIFQALKPDETTLECTVYTSTDENPRYITDPSCQRLGILTIQLPPHSAGQTLEIEETLIFGDTEILCRARDLRTGRISEVQFDLL
ncbi:heat shock 70 kDa protein 12A-like [Mytilus galloprovincialis]|uniref:heat shock 70 kDa protein 12A-like n=1 Tax=Mytilus galloprovincialis TaxID=29158 RepID=UPI003F7CB0D3